MLKVNSCESSDSDTPSQDSSSEEEETVEVNGFQVLPSQVSTKLFNSLFSNRTLCLILFNTV